MTATSATARRWTLLTHRDPDIDDVEALRLLKKYGGERYPGIEEARIKTLSQRDHLKSTTPEALEEGNTLLVGIGGSKFDEHAVDGRGRKLNDCATTLVAKELEIDEIPWLQENLEYAFSRNYNLASSDFEIAPLVKAAFRYLSHSGESEKDRLAEKVILDAAFLLLEAAEKNEDDWLHGRRAPSAVTLSIDEFVAGWLSRTFDPKGRHDVHSYAGQATEGNTTVTRLVAARLGKLEDETLKRIFDYVDECRKLDAAGRKKKRFELAALVHFAQEQFCVGENAEAGRKALNEAVGIFLDGLWGQKKNFLVDCKKDYESPSTRTFEKKCGRLTLKVVSVVSANAEINKYCRSERGGKAHVIIQQNPLTGNMFLAFDQKRGIDLDSIVAGIRIAERREKGHRDILIRERLIARGGEVEGAEEWYYEGNYIMNGSLTVDRRPTKLSREKVEKIVMQHLRLK